MKRLILLTIFVILIGVSFVSACRDADAEFTVKIKTNIDLNPILPHCSEETCIQEDFYIVLRSQYNEEVAVIFGDNLETFGSQFEGIMIRLPYDLDGGFPIISTIDPGEFNWSECVKTDLVFLKDLGVINLTIQEINTISELSDGGKNIQLCEEGWDNPNYFFTCPEDCGDEGCLLPACIGEAIMLVLPRNKLAIGQKSNYIFYIGAAILLIIILFLLLRRKRQIFKN